jgi:hypothetical protein
MVSGIVAAPQKVARITSIIVTPRRSLCGNRNVGCIRDRASFETAAARPPLDDEVFDGIKKIPHPEEAAKAVVSKDALRPSSRSSIPPHALLRE